jgi:hypothetical protein
VIALQLLAAWSVTSVVLGTAWAIAGHRAKTRAANRDTPGGTR